MIEKIRVGLAGAGGLGSNCAACLVRAGFKRLTIVDFDKVSLKNLNRQFYFRDQIGMDKVKALKANLLRINPHLKLKVIKAKVGKANIARLFGDCDVVVECFDRPEYKSMLIGELLDSGKFIVAASGLGGFGASDNIKVHKVKNNLVIIGDLESDIKRAPAFSPKVNIAAAKQADVVLEFALKRE